MSKEKPREIDTSLLIWEIKSSIFVGFMGVLFIDSLWENLNFHQIALIAFLSGPAMYLLILGLYLFIQNQCKDGDIMKPTLANYSQQIYKDQTKDLNLSLPFISAFSFEKEIEIKTPQKPEEIKERLLHIVDAPIKWYQLRPPYQRKPYEGIVEDHYFSIQSFEDQLKIEAIIDEEDEMTLIRMKIYNLANLQLASYQVSEPVPKLFEINQEQNIPPFQLALFATIVVLIINAITYLLDVPFFTMGIITLVLIALSGFIVAIYSRYYRNKIGIIFDKHISFLQELFR